MLVIGAGCATPAPGCGRVLAVPPMGAIGRVSYSWYLWHWPLLVIAPALLGHALRLAARLTAALVSPGLAALTVRFLENPLRFAAPCAGSPAQSRAGGCRDGGRGRCGRGTARIGYRPGRPRPCGPDADRHRDACTTGSDMAAYDAAVQRGFAQVQAAVAASAELKAVPSNLTPGLAGEASELKAIFSAAACAIRSKADNPNARRAIPPRRRGWS